MSVNFEIVELYPMYGIPKNKLVYNAHVYLIDYDLDIRGFVVHAFAKDHPKNVKQQSKVYSPMAFAWDTDEEKVARFPVVSMTDKTLIDDIKKELIIEGKKRIKTFKFPKKFPKNFMQYKAIMFPKKKPTV